MYRISGVIRRLPPDVCWCSGGAGGRLPRMVYPPSLGGWRSEFNAAPTGVAVNTKITRILWSGPEHSPRFCLSAAEQDAQRPGKALGFPTPPSAPAGGAQPLRFARRNPSRRSRAPPGQSGSGLEKPWFGSECSYFETIVFIDTYTPNCICVRVHLPLFPFRFGAIYRHLRFMFIHFFSRNSNISFTSFKIYLFIYLSVILFFCAF